MTSARSSVPPFHAMEMAGLATAREATGASVIHLEVGQPWSPAPAAVLAAAAPGARARPDRLHQRQRPALAAQADRPALRGLVRRRARSCRASWSPPAPRPGSPSPSWPASTPATAWASSSPATPATGTRCSRSGSSPSPSPSGRSRRWAPTPELLDAAGPLDGLVVASPSNPTGTVLARRAAGRGRRLVPRPRRPADLRRDLPRHHLRAAGRERARAVERRRRGVAASPSTSR